MSQYQTYKSYSLPNQLVQLQTQWAGMKANQIYSSEQGVLFETPVRTYTNTTANSQPSDYGTTYYIHFPANVSFCVIDIYWTKNGVRQRWFPGITNYDVWTDMCEPSPVRGSSGLNVWTFPILLNFINACESVEVVCVSNVKPSKVNTSL